MKPVPFEMPEDGYASIVIKNEKGEIVRNLLNASFRPAGANTRQWDGLTTPGLSAMVGEPVEPGAYTWSGLWHKGIGSRLRGFASSGGTTPWGNGPGTDWGGDMGPPAAAAAEGDFVLLGWTGAEAGKAAVLCDLDGIPKWSNKRGGFGGAPFVGLDSGVAYIVDAAVYKLRVDTSAVVPWSANGTAETSTPA